MYPPIYQIVKLLYVNFKSKKYSKYNIENDLDHNENLLSNLELNVEFIKSTLNKNGLKKTDARLERLVKRLASINLELWDIEEGKRLAEKNNDFGETFIKLARDVYKKNDSRAKIKLEINKVLGSNINEIKSYH